MKTNIIETILEAAFNGVCLASENGDTKDYRPGDVTPTNFNTNSFRVHIPATGQVFVLRVEEQN